MNLKVIAYARNGHTDKFGIPRQSRDESPIVTRIVFEPEYSVREALRGIEGFSHLWLVWGFSEITRSRDHVTTIEDETAPLKDWSPTVRPPRLGGNKRMGVFATRSPFRPNPIGISSVRLLGVKENEITRSRDHVTTTARKAIELLVSGADLMDGTPIYDIKPYLSFSDSHPEAVNGFAEETKDYKLQVAWDKGEGSPRVAEDTEYCLGLTRRDLDMIPTEVRRDIEYILSQDPRPAYQDDPEREYKFEYAGWTVTFCVKGQSIFVKKAQKRTF